ncbi:hypothetical protein D9757_008687 [Collybiopsis confluens]|uniref:Uncharacterized protein n=1 Tax=Collybiopsis confluens TaxID=2823264 RepID=A0A8H5M0I4_9AGAR|nr:hypothetical protein D9757_008687 [Collybiopsis confluens]
MYGRFSLTTDELQKSRYKKRSKSRISPSLLMALTTIASVFQIFSGVCDTDSHLGASIKIKGLVPESNDQIYAFIVAKLEETNAFLEPLHQKIMAGGTIDHKRRFRAAYNEYMKYSQLSDGFLTQCNKRGRPQKWFAVLHLDYDRQRAERLKQLRESVLINQDVVIKTSKQIRDELMDIGVITIVSMEDSDSTSIPGEVHEPSTASVEPDMSIQIIPAEVAKELVKVITESLPNEDDIAGSSISGLPICRVNSTESWCGGEMKGAIPLKNWKKHISNVLATNSSSHTYDI